MLRCLLALALAAVPLSTLAQSSASGSSPAILNASEAGAILPPAVFFRGQTASIQARNSAGIRFSKDAFLLAALVDTSGYSSSVQQKYQAYLITETALEIGGHRLPPGAYGCGFVANETFVVMDIGGHDLFTTAASHDADLRRPTPLQILAAPAARTYRLYAGRNFVELSATQPTAP
ncbi:hypothetical protein [Edaphobacter modestus]|uniref:Uncharacterized protein n=1 Tax=Edaphobacter modestus TaxID=388466 RepID=A0A4Q7YSS0_9BACT|nr:hypothetical protein [Edaphobacter modestus]RZU40061.1 hypothetical protein BDD14_1484 [Edaphobacter modestus]